MFLIRNTGTQEGNWHDWVGWARGVGAAGFPRGIVAVVWIKRTGRKNWLELIAAVR